MADVNKKWSPGDRLDLSADFLNLTTENNRAYLRGRRMVGSNAPPVHSATKLYVMNASGSDLAQFSVVGIGEQIAGPTDDDTSHFGDGAFNSASPASASPFAILQDPAPDEEMAIAIFSGPSYCRVSVSNAAHTYAAPSAGVYTHLVSQAAVGPAKILWKEAGGTLLNGAIDDTVTNITVDDTDGFPATPFVVTIGTEDLNVTAVRGSTQLNGDVGIQDTVIEVDSSANFPPTPFVAVIGTERINVTNVTGTTWTVERHHHNSVAAEHLDSAAVTAYADTFWTVARGHNSTTATSHADNAAVALKTGTVWALVAIDSQQSGGTGNITSINGDTTAAQVLSVGTSGTDFAITDTGAGTLRFDLPDASATARGAVTTGTQGFRGAKIFGDTISTHDGNVLTDGLGITNDYIGRYMSGSLLGCKVVFGDSGDGFDSLFYDTNAWNSATAYEIGDLISYLGIIYRCRLAHTNQTPAVGAYWEATYEQAVLALMGDGPGNSGGTPSFNQQPCFAVLEGTFNNGTSHWMLALKRGKYATVAGLTFSGGLLTGGSFTGLTSSWTGSTSVTTLGTITTGVWQGTAIADTYIASAATWNAKLDSMDSSWAGSTSITTLGTIATGTWEGSPIGDGYISSASTWNSALQPADIGVSVQAYAAALDVVTGTNTGDQDDSTVSYTATTSGDWNGAAPTTVRDALDRCAALLKTLNGGTGP